MRVTHSTKRKNKWFSQRFNRRYLSHFYKYRASGELLPKRHFKRWKHKTAYCVISYIVIIYLVTRILEVYYRLDWKIPSSATGIDIFGNLDNLVQFKSEGFFHLLNGESPLMSIIIAGVLCVIPAIIIGLVLNMKFKPIADGQKGDNRLKTLKEIQGIFKEIPDKKETFPGYGGIPITHYKDKWYIQTDTVHTCVIGTSRSGKGQLVVLSSIDIQSRAELQSSLIVNDPKGELYVASKDELEDRGYDVYAYNVTDPLQSMSDNPLALIIKYWQRGDIDTATQLTNTFTNTIYYDANASDNKYFNENAQKAVNALIFALLEQSDKTGDYSRVTPNNLVELLSEIGGFNYQDPTNEFKQLNALDEFMNQLPPDNVAKKQYGATKIGSEKAKGNILSTAITGLNPFTLTKIAKMTSQSTIEYKSIGFPKYLDIKVDESLLNKRLQISFYHKKQKIGEEFIKIGFKGFCEINFDVNLTEGDEICLSSKDEGETYESWYTFSRVKLHDEKGNTIYQKKRGKKYLPEWNKEAKLKADSARSNLRIESIRMHYSDKPTAIFMLTPDYDSSNHVIVSIFISQMYKELSTQCGKTRGAKCHRRVQLNLDEVGNMPAIDDMDNKLTVSASRNILWNLFVQSYQQIFAKYGEQNGKTIKENCQTHIYIMSTDEETIEEFSKKVGSKTVEQESSTVNEFGMNKSINRIVDSDRILTPERIATFLEGETIVLAPLKRRDLKGHKVRPFPIFNTGKTNLPYAYEYLEEFNPSGDINDIDIYSPHADLNLKDFQIDYDYFLPSAYAKEMYHSIQDNQYVVKSKEDLTEFQILINQIPSEAIKQQLNLLYENNDPVVEEYLTSQMRNGILDPVVGKKLIKYIKEYLN